MKIYYAKVLELTGEEQLEVALRALPDKRLEKIERTKQKKSQLQSISAGLLLEYALCKLELSGKNVTFLEYADGKPYLKEYPNLCYNLSHSGKYVALVVDERPVGIDIEQLRRGYQKLVKRFFSEEEVRLFDASWDDELFTKLWTRKESYLKATGYGMRMPLDGFSTCEDSVQINERMYEEMINKEDIYYLQSFQIEDYWLSVCRKDIPVDTQPEKVDLKEIL